MLKMCFVLFLIWEGHFLVSLVNELDFRPLHVFYVVINRKYSLNYQNSLSNLLLMFSLRMG